MKKTEKTLKILRMLHLLCIGILLLAAVVYLKILPLPEALRSPIVTLWNQHTQAFMTILSLLVIASAFSVFLAAGIRNKKAEDDYTELLKKNEKILPLMEERHSKLKDRIDDVRRSLDIEQIEAPHKFKNQLQSMDLKISSMESLFKEAQYEFRSANDHLNFLADRTIPAPSIHPLQQEWERLTCRYPFF